MSLCGSCPKQESVKAPTLVTSANFANSSLLKEICKGHLQNTEQIVPNLGVMILAIVSLMFMRFVLLGQFDRLEWQTIWAASWENSRYGIYERHMVQASPRICAVSPEPYLFAHLSGWLRGNLSQRARNMALLRSRAIDGNIKEPFLSRRGSFILMLIMGKWWNCSIIGTR